MGDFVLAAEANAFRPARYGEPPLYCGPGEGNLIKHYVPYNLRVGEQPGKLESNPVLQLKRPHFEVKDRRS